MEKKANKLKLEEITALDYWKQIPMEDIDALMLYQKIEQSINEFISLLNVQNLEVEGEKLMYLTYNLSISLRDFTVLLRDVLLGVTKYEQYRKDSKIINPSFIQENQKVIQLAAAEIDNNIKKGAAPKEVIKEWKSQNSPIETVVFQLKELEKQCKKIYRSISKVDDIRSNIGEYVRDFQLQYSFQTSAINTLFTTVDEIKALSQNVSVDLPEIRLNNIVDQIGNKIQDLEQIQNTESIDILPYPNRETLNLPVSTSKGSLHFKSVNIKSEFARWFSSFIYPKIIELESKRDHAIEKCLLSFRQVQTKIAAIPIAESATTPELQKEFEVLFKQIEKDALNPLRIEEQANQDLVTEHINSYLKASNIYSDRIMFLPESSSSQITNISKDAQRRIVSYFDKYNKQSKAFINRILSRYIEVDKTSYRSYIKNKLSINDEDDSLALFLKNGYLGKSFTVSRPEILNSILQDYNLWKEGFSGAILLSGLTGSGKSTMIGMLNQLGLNEEIIQLKMGESYFIHRRSYEPICDLKEIIDSVIKRTLGRRIVVCIDDLDHWHDENTNLFDNISKLLNSISKHRKKIFFVVSCSSFLIDRLDIFKDLNPVFSKQITLRAMNSNQIKLALNLRARVNDIDDGSESELDSRFRYIVRESSGNPGAAMLEHCRMFSEHYKSNVKSSEFNQLIKTHHTLLSYISSYYQISINFLKESLSDLDFRNTMESMEHLVSQKILIRPKKGYVALNPFLIHAIENILNYNSK